jgi:hypothetical protein
VVYTLATKGRESEDVAQQASMALAEHLSRDHTSAQIRSWLASGQTIRG